MAVSMDGEFRAPYACDPEHSRGPAACGAGEQEPQRLPPRLRPHHPFHRLPPAQAQDPGLRVRRRRPLPHPAHPHARSRADRARAGAALRLDEDLAEALALAHDLGHPPFGHAGERALDACLAAFGGFDHNAQTLRVVTALERRYPSFDGLNLTWETLEGLVKHNGPLTDRDGTPLGRYRAHGRSQDAFRDYSAASGSAIVEFPERRGASRRDRRRHRL